MRQSVEGQCIVVSGAAHGIGASVARALAQRGAQLALLDVDRDELRTRAEALGAAAICCDVADAQATSAAVDDAASRLGRLDCIVANAGVHAVATTDTIAPQGFRRVIEVNLLGAWNTLRAGVPHLARTNGYLLAVTSLAAALHLPTQGAYAASKAGLEALIDVMRLELRSIGVGVGCAYFGPVDTALTRKIRQTPAARAAGRASRRVARPIAVDEAAAAVVRAIESRARWAFAPRRIAPFVVARALPQVLAEVSGPAARERIIEAARSAPASLEEGAPAAAAPVPVDPAPRP